MNINGIRSEAFNSPGSVLILSQYHILPTRCSVLNTHVGLAGVPAYRLEYNFLAQKFIF
jgi:hypothetical protein